MDTATDTYPDVMTPTQAMKYLQIGRTLFYRQVNAGIIPGVKIGHIWRFHRNALSQYIHHGSINRSADPGIEPMNTIPPPGIKRQTTPGRNLSPSARRQKKRELVEHLKTGITMAAAAKAVGVSPVSVRNWRHADKGYDAEVSALIGQRQT